MPESQADVQAELMAEAFGCYADNILTKGHFEAVLDARFGEFGAQIGSRLAEQDAKFDKRFTALELRIDKLEERMARVEDCIQQLTKRTIRMERTLFVRSWIPGIGVTSLVVPQLNAWLVQGRFMPLSLCRCRLRGTLKQSSSKDSGCTLRNDNHPPSDVQRIAVM